MAESKHHQRTRPLSKEEEQQSVKDDTSEDAVVMKRQIGLFSSITIVVGSIIGSGIFISPKGVLEYSGSVGGALIVWSLCGVIATLGGMCYAELGSSIKKGGGEYTYLNEAFGEFLAFFMLWVNFVIVSPGNTAIIAQTFATYAIVPFYGDCDPPPWAITLLAEACIVLVFTYNSYSVHAGTAIQSIFTVAKVGGLMIIIFGGIVFLFMGSRFQTWGDLALGPLAWLMPVTVAMSTFGSVNSGALSNSRYVFVGARDRLLPTLLSMIHIRNLTPLPALIAMMLITCTLCLYQDTSSLITFTGFSYWLFVGIVTTGLVWLRYKRPHMERPFKVPIVIPILFALICYTLVTISIFAAPFEAFVGTVIILTGIPIYLYGVVWKNKPNWLRKFLDRSLEYLQMLMYVVPQEKASY
ncbi:cystine/glutamate transporter-like [Saccoglossus kowalevskii]|uniref:Cystine/glutamate transporter-like n=1 Tax=Saccoglossus kowalevskii TaxID=10224 RepID=A0ABM0LVY8_SACKO|nr:PREDICTED: cystine/glutamate transporter-like [Saccoglossus kowalevskii]